MSISTNQSPTPRTDRLETEMKRQYEMMREIDWPCHDVTNIADFARTLERELADSQSALNIWIDKYNSSIQSNANLMKEIAEKDRKLDELRESCRGKSEIIFVRFGLPPKDCASKNYLTGEYEAGTSCYEAVLRNGIVNILLPKTDSRILVSLSGVNSRPLFQVRGNVIGAGSDGEPILNPCHVVKLITHSTQFGQ